VGPVQEPHLGPRRLCQQPVQGQPPGRSCEVEHARKAGRAQGRRAGRTVASRQRSGDIRAWAKQQGLAVSERGRIPASVVEQYQAAGKGH
jgi:Lsr2